MWAACSRSAAGTPEISSTASGVVQRQQLEQRLVALGARGDEVGVGEPVAVDDVRDAEHHGRVGAGPRREVQDAVVGELDPARVDRHELHPAQRRLLDPRADDRVALGRVGADQDRRVGVVEVGEGAGRAGEAERLAQRERRRRVADARAVVDVVGADRGAHQALHRVAVLVGRARGGEAGDRVGAVLGLDPVQLGRDPVDRLLPASPGGSRRPRGSAARSGGRGGARTGARSAPSGTCGPRWRDRRAPG